MRFEGIERAILQHGDVRILGTGTRLVRHVPTVAPEAFLFTLYPGLTVDDVAQVEAQLKRKLPSAYAALLRASNGLSIFVGTLVVFGARATYARTGDAARQPVDLIDPNTMDRPRIPKDAVIIGGYREDGSLLYMRAGQDDVLWTTERGGSVRRTWPSLEAFLLEEISRLTKLIGENYASLRYDSDVNTLPEVRESQRMR